MLKDSNSFASFSTNDVDAAREFYADKLGLDADIAEMGVLRLRLREGTVMIYPKGEAHAAANFTVLNFMVPEIDKAVGWLKEKNIELERYDDPSIKQDDLGVFRGKERNQGPNIAWFKDPGGNTLAVIEE